MPRPFAPRSPSPRILSPSVMTTNLTSSSGHFHASLRMLPLQVQGTSSQYTNACLGPESFTPLSHDAVRNVGLCRSLNCQCESERLKIFTTVSLMEIYIPAGRCSKWLHSWHASPTAGREKLGLEPVQITAFESLQQLQYMSLYLFSGDFRGRGMHEG